MTYTASGTTGLRAARERPQVPIVALSPVLQTARRLSLAVGDALRGNPRCRRPRRHGRSRLPDCLCRGLCGVGDRVIITAGVPLRTPGSTNMLRIAYIGSDGLGGI